VDINVIGITVTQHLFVVYVLEPVNDFFLFIFRCLLPPITRSKETKCKPKRRANKLGRDHGRMTEGRLGNAVEELLPLSLPLHGGLNYRPDVELRAEGRPRLRVELFLLLLRSFMQFLLDSTTLDVPEKYKLSGTFRRLRPHLVSEQVLHAGVLDAVSLGIWEASR